MEKIVLDDNEAREMMRVTALSVLDDLKKLDKHLRLSPENLDNESMRNICKIIRGARDAIESDIVLYIQSAEQLRVPWSDVVPWQDALKEFTWPTNLSKDMLEDVAIHHPEPRTTACHSIARVQLLLGMQ